MSSATCFNLDQSKLLSSGKGLKNEKLLWRWQPVIGFSIQVAGRKNKLQNLLSEFWIFIDLYIQMYIVMYKII